MHVHIRPAAAGDASDIARVKADSIRAAYAGFASPAYLARVGREVADGSRTALAAQSIERASNDRGLVLIAECEGSIVGMGVVEFDGEDRPAPSELFFDPNWLGRGIGSVLHGALLQAAAELGVTELVLDTLRENVRARTFYENQGWQLAGEYAYESVDGEILHEVRYRRSVVSAPPRGLGG